jgi:hypothetical protein
LWTNTTQSQRQIRGKHWRKYILIEKRKQTNKQINNEVIIIIITIIGTIIITVIAYYKND